MLALDPAAQVSSSTEINPGIVEVPAVMPAGFDPSLWNLLQDIKNAGVPLVGKVAEYAGFYIKISPSISIAWDATTDNGDDPDVAQTWTNQPNASLDKLTFLIMFRLPFRSSTPNVHYGDPISGPANTWSYRANQLRTGSLRRLNTAGEQVDVNNLRCDDSGAPLDSAPDELNTPTAYQYYGQTGANLTGTVATAVKAQPIYLYLAITTEASFTKPDPGDDTLTVVQIPENILGLTGGDQTPAPVRRRREVDIGLYLPAGPQGVFTSSATIANFATTYQVDGCMVGKETAGAHVGEYYVTPKNLASARVYVSLKYPAEKLVSNNVHTRGATIFEMNGLRLDAEANAYYASYFTSNRTRFKFGFTGSGDVQFENLAIGVSSGMTMAWGYDIGQGLREGYQYNIEFKIWAYAQAAQLPAGSKFELRYKNRVEPIPFTASEGEMETHLRTLLRLKEFPWAGGPKTIAVTKVTNTGDANYPTRWDIKIVRANMDPEQAATAPWRDVDGFFGLYSSNVFYQPAATESAQSPKIKITPALEEDRYLINTSAAATKAWTDFTTFLTNLFGGQSWRDPSHFTGATTADIDNFEDMLRGALNIRKGNAFLAVINHNSLLKKFRLPTIDLLFPRWVEFFMKPRYYNKKKAKVTAGLFPRFNAAEKYVMTTIAYSGNVFQNDDLEEAVRTKNLTRLVEVVHDRNESEILEHRRETIASNLVSQFKKQLYRNIEED